RPGVTVAQMLSNSAGLVGLRDGSLDSPYPCQFLPAGTLQDCARAIATTTADAGEAIPPDREFRYGGGQWQLAGGVAEAVTGRSWAELVRRTLADPCGLGSLGYTNHFERFGMLRGPLVYPAAFDGD